MNYQAYKLKFNTAVHFGKRRLEDGESSFSADVLFSALCHEAIQLYGQEGIEQLFELAINNKVRFSDTLPYHEHDLYIPKPMIHIENKEEGDSSEKKLYKRLNYLRWERLLDYLSGDFDVKEEISVLENMGKKEIRTFAMIMDEDDAKPYSVGTYTFNKEWGLYFIFAYEESEDKAYIEELLMSLELSGIGGKRNSGLGKFTLNPCKLSEVQKQMLSDAKATHHIALSSCMAKSEELESVLNGAQYSLIKKSGFVASETYATGIYRKKDLFMFKSGSSFAKRFDGIVADVSNEGNHPVYRYAMPIFLGVTP